jgi:UDP-N-acetylmuramyl pentapeptide phosphotransferase/UDP-N-acetylglucosamine-1-phosphate transferase
MMSLPLFYALCVLAPFALVFFLSPWMVGFCRRQGLVADHNEARHIHTKPTPHGGGLLLVLIGVPLGFYVTQHAQLPYAPWLQTMLVLSVLVAAVGWLDDKHGLSARVRFMVHLTCVAVTVWLMPPLFDVLPWWADKIITTLAWTWFISLYNFMNGADGLAESEAVFIAAAVGVLVPQLTPLCLVVAGAALGFLRVNWHPAKLFLGDTGSTWLGYVLGGLLLLPAANDGWRLTAPLATITLVFCADATWTLFRRVMQGHNPLVPHRRFWFHRALDLGLSHSQLVWRVLGLDAILFLMAVASLMMDQPWLSLVAGSLLMVLVGLNIRQAEALRRLEQTGIKKGTKKR